ncbi:MAG: serine/threonine protein kinase [Planctomycetes bacterium]|nr:serine/threonine protein kinase [Planctomycetota bacterium]MCB9904350.1 serine/threonine protein kinase [Planctomycetota bacterium]
MSTPPDSHSDRSMPDSIGPYRILELLGEGGMGEVWMAEQREPVKRRVALKMLKLGMDSRQVLARFEVERQALAMMDHPNIARVFDAGRTDDGRPYFVMEYIRGVPILEYCDKQKLGTEERLRLFLRVCHAIQHAHQKGVIHRDIKPSNVLVTLHDGEPVPKVIDFGVAKAIDTSLTEQTLFTEHRQMIGTPAYMSPEQAEMSGLGIDTRSDIYSLGVLLYEMLTGTVPFGKDELLTKGVVEMLRVIREVEPERPSTRVRTMGDTATRIAVERSETTYARLGSRLRGDLDWIVMKCLEKDRTRRYETANGLAMDIERHLADEPVQAGPPSATYRLRKFVRRNRGGVTAAVLLLLALVAGVAGTSWGLMWALDEKDRADVEAQRATDAALAESQRALELQRVVEFQAGQLRGIDVELMGARLRDELLAEVRAAARAARLDASETEDRATEFERLLAGVDFTGISLKSLEENVLQPSLDAIHADFASQPLVQAGLLHTLAEIATELDVFPIAASAEETALAIRRRELGDDDPATIASIQNLGKIRSGQSRFDEADELSREAVTRAGTTYAEDDAELIGLQLDRVALLNNISRHEEAQKLLAVVFAAAARCPDMDPELDLNLSGARFIATMNTEDFETAEVQIRESLKKCREQLGEDDTMTINRLGWLGVCLQRLRRFDEAEDCMREHLAANRRVYGSNHASTLMAENNLGWLLRAAGKYEDAEHHLRQAYEGRRKLLGEHHQHTLASLRNLGQLYHQWGRKEEAEPYARRAVEGMRRYLPPNHSDTIWAERNLARILIDLGRNAEAVEYVRSVWSANRESNGATHDETLYALRLLDGCLESLGRRAELITAHRELVSADSPPPAIAAARRFAEEGCASTNPADAAQRWRYRELLADVLLVEGDRAGAMNALEQVIAEIPAEQPERDDVVRRLADLRDAAKLPR